MARKTQTCMYGYGSTLMMLWNEAKTLCNLKPVVVFNNIHVDYNAFRVDSVHVCTIYRLTKRPFDRSSSASSSTSSSSRFNRSCSYSKRLSSISDSVLPPVVGRSSYSSSDDELDEPHEGTGLCERALGSCLPPVVAHVSDAAGASGAARRLFR
jgi:hypothetical protein